MTTEEKLDQIMVKLARMEEREEQRYKAIVATRELLTTENVNQHRLAMEGDREKRSPA